MAFIQKLRLAKGESFTLKAKDLNYDLDDLHKLDIADLSFENKK